MSGQGLQGCNKHVRRAALISPIPADWPPASLDAAAPVDEFALLTAQVRAIYVALYRQFKNAPDYGKGSLPYDGGVDRWGRNHKDGEWPKLARHLVFLEADPLVYMQAQFYGTPAGALDGWVPTPNSMRGAKAVLRYQHYVAGAERTAHNLLQHGLASIAAHVVPWQTSGMPYHAALRLALFNVSQVTACPLVRYCVAKQEGVVDVAECYRRKALMQYVFQQRVFDEVLGAGQARVLQELQEDAARLKCRIFGGRIPRNG